MLNAKIEALLFPLVQICTSSWFCRIIAFTIAGRGAENIVVPGWQPIAHCFQNCCHGPWINSGMETIQVGAWTFGSNWSVATATALASIHGFASWRNRHHWHSSCICGASRSHTFGIPIRAPMTSIFYLTFTTWISPLSSRKRGPRRKRIRRAQSCVEVVACGEGHFYLIFPSHSLLRIHGVAYSHKYVTIRRRPDWCEDGGFQ